MLTDRIVDLISARIEHQGKKLIARIKQESARISRIDYQANGHYENGTCVF
ncbi:hypothetical protein [Actinoalloteichus hymeniacidonis]|uniref:hypothetical protein n=1 Tax=Actinoalloteichus hymeniacidonis TaxID=340345 RepID=UPI0012F83FBA|nr:hypothetical protein [Actinoalloteichus hymeniacidonis]MBB5910799.1 hypothetical protein [Actinoalloteichus hymeniacidonis]